MTGEKEYLERDRRTIFEKWGVREVVTAVLLSALTIVIMFIGARLTLFDTNFQIASGACGVFLAAPVFMLMTMRVNRFGSTLVFCLMAMLLFCVAGNFLYLIPFYVAGGIAIDAVFLRTGSQRQNPWWITAAWTVFSGLYLLSTLVPYLGSMDAYIEQTVANRGVDQAWVDTFLHFYSDPVWIAAIFVITMIAGFLGSLVGRVLTQRHVSRAGAR